MVIIKNHLLTMIGFFMVLIALVALHPQSSYAQPPTNSPKPAQDVNVVNPDSEPVPTYNVDNPAFQPVHDSFFCPIQSFETCCSSTKTVPVGKRLVIELVTARGLVLEGVSTLLRLRTTTSNLSGTPLVSLNHAILLNVAGHFTSSAWGFDRIKATQPVRLYVDPGTEILMEFCREIETDAPAQVDVSISGYLVDIE
jgi:hypothetical protein